MTNSNNRNGTSYKLTKKDFNQINRRSLFAYQLGWNYERMQASGYLYTILPQLRKIYGDGTPELKEMMKTHTQFFNTSNFFNTIIMGIDIAMEEKEKVKAKDSVQGLKVGLMGPFAAIGDSIFASLIPTIFGALAANMAINGNTIGAFIWLAAQIAVMVFRVKGKEARLKTGSLAGSILRMNQGLKNLLDFTGDTLENAWRTTSLNQAKALKIDNQKGSIKPGKDADLILVDEDINVLTAIKKGKIHSFS